jgi:hypothetical protein
MKRPFCYLGLNPIDFIAGLFAILGLGVELRIVTLVIVAPVHRAIFH